MARHVADALGKGGKLLAGGHKLQGHFFEPAVISEAIADMLCAREETFGPFDPVFRFQKDQEAIDAASNTEFGLAIYFYSRDIGREASSHGIKEHIGTHRHEAPLSGRHSQAILEQAKMTVIVSIEAKDLLVLRGSGVLMRAEVDEAKHKVAAHIMENGKVHLLMMVEEGFSNLQAFASWDDIAVDKYIQQNVIRMAITGDLRWRDSALLFFLNSMVPFQMEYFKSDQEEFARAWLVL